MGDAVDEELLAGARRVLDANRLDGLTVPHRTMFAGAYLWDIAPIAKGLAVYDPQRAAAELERYLESQWAHGLLPNEVYYRERALRRRMFGHHPARPAGLVTSGITQPPMIVRSALEVGRRLGRERREAFFRSVFGKLRLMFEWVLRERVGRNGLAVAIHPYETGMDNRIDLAEAMSAEWLDSGSMVGGWARRTTAEAVGLARRAWGDCRTVPVAHRSSNADVLAALMQTHHIRTLDYDLAAIEASGRGVLVEDVGYNAVLVDAFACLREMAAEIGEPEHPDHAVDADTVAAMQRLADAVEGLWHADPGDPGHGGGYYSRDYRTGRLLLRPTVAGLFPLLVTRDAARVRALVDTLTDPSKYWTRVVPPSAPVDSEAFAPDRYWRGAAWSFPADIIETALEVQQEGAAARELRRRYLRRPYRTVHAEYENPLTGQPRGARPFSPAAALTIRLAARESRSPAGRRSPSVAT